MAKKTTTKTTKESAAVEVLYTVSELAEAAEAVFALSPDVVTAALKCQGLGQVGLKQAQQIVTAYANKEVQ